MIDLSATPFRRRLLFGALYFSEGAPMGFLWWYLPPALRARGVPVDEVTALTASLALPWALKFVWAPVVDLVRGPRFSIRGWIVCAQLGMALTMLPLLFNDVTDGLGALLPILLAHAFFAATQDVAVDAWAIAATDERERGSINASMQAGMLLGRVTFSAGALAMADLLGPSEVAACLIGAICMSLFLVAFARHGAPGGPQAGRGRQARVALRRFVSSPATWLGAVVALVGGAGFEVVGGLAGSFLIDDGRSQQQVGLFTAVAALVSIPGAVVGGMVADRLGAPRAALGGLLALTTTVGLLATSVATAAPAWTHLGALISVYVALGAFTASSYALFMSLTVPGLSASAFSAFMGLTNVCEFWAVRTGGELAATQGYATAFAVPAAIALLAAPALLALRRPRQQPAQCS